MQPIRDNARVLTAAAVGTTVEYYDFYIYGTAAALVFGPLFFPAASPELQTLYAFMSFGLAFFARAVGALVFGHYGDRIGRKSTLVLSLLIMGGSTLAIAFLPTYQMVGWIAPVLLCVMRFAQGFGLGGEWSGAALLAIENAPKGWEGRFGAAPQLGIPAGFLFSNGIFLVLGWQLTEAQFADWGWRIPFLFSAVLVFVGLWIRNRIGETPQFKALLAREAPARVPFFDLLRGHSGTMLAGAAGVIVVYTAFYIGTAWALAEGTTRLGYPREAFLGAQLLANVTMTLGILLSAWLADRTSPARALSWGAVAVAVAGLIFVPGLTSGSYALVTLTLCVTMFCMGLTCGPLGTWLTQLFPVKLRFSGSAFAFQFGGILGGAVTPFLAQLMSVGGHSGYVGLLLSAAGLVSLAGFMLARRADQVSG